MHSGSFSSIEEFVSKPIKGSKRFRRILHRPNYSFLPDPWQKALNDFLIQKDLIKRTFTYANSKIISPKFHDRKLGLLQRKRQFLGFCYNRGAKTVEIVISFRKSHFSYTKLLILDQKYPFKLDICKNNSRFQNNSSSFEKNNSSYRRIFPYLPSQNVHKKACIFPLGPSRKDVRSKLGLFDPLPPCPSYDVTVTT